MPVAVVVTDVCYPRQTQRLSLCAWPFSAKHRDPVNKSSPLPPVPC